MYFVITFLYTCMCFYNKYLLCIFVSVSPLKPEEMPKVRIDTDERQSAGYEVNPQKLV